ncbi:hypothetical protein GCM10009836_68810 [Pseudonocardia ailaonensis]|uniref:Uncharacterized protein n=1 Tax=Pseudonocardia ailaonensis TaxID=367279 RepID=A0ABN2NNH0_9PSEU
MSDRRTTTLTVPAHDHVSWCRNHDVSLFDSQCSTERWLLVADYDLPSDPSRVVLSAFQHSLLREDTQRWEHDAPLIELFLPTDEPGQAAYAVLTPAEARKVAAELLNLAELVETETGRCAR